MTPDDFSLSGGSTQEVINNSLTITFDIEDDPLVEDREFFTFSIEPPSDIDFIDNGPFTVNISNNDCECRSDV